MTDGLYARDLETPPAKPKDFPVTIAFLVLQVLAGAVLSFVVFIALFQYDACMDDCNRDLGNVALYGMFGVAVLSAVVTLTMSIIRRIRRGRSWWIPVAGLAILLIVFCLSLFLIDIGSMP